MLPLGLPPLVGPLSAAMGFYDFGHLVEVVDVEGYVDAVVPVLRHCRFGQTVIDAIAKYSPNFKDLILHAEVRTPKELEDEVGLTEGNIFQGELTLDQLMFNRPIPGYAQYRSPIPGLYMCGSSCHPGGGVMAAPGANAAREILIDVGGRR